MTAEVAILNKLGIALAADSAVTISQGSDSQKVFNTADKLFELSKNQPIACMVFNNLQFMQAPLQVLIKEFRNNCVTCKTVSEASQALFNYLQEFSDQSSAELKNEAVQANGLVIYDLLVSRVRQQYERRLSEPNFFENVEDAAAKVRQNLSEVWDVNLNVLERFAESWPDAEFISDCPTRETLEPLFIALFEGVDQKPPDSKRERVIDLLSIALRKASPFELATGIVVAGYGSQEIFPTLEHFELYSPVIGSLKYRCVERADIARSGPRARVVAFAQREMAERFLFGLDVQTKEKILRFCKNTISTVGDYAASLVDLGDDEKAANFRTAIANAEQTFVAGLETAGMDAIRQDSQTAVEDMVEFMPKQDLAEFAEALVNLSSLQRRVNSGFETVGGPIDVAVISKSEGLVWVKRKHYFPSDLNARFFNRIGGNEL